MNKNVKRQNGVTLVSLVIVIIVILIISGVILYNVKSNLGIKELKSMQADIENLRGKVSNYYLQYGALPIIKPNIEDNVLTNITKVSNENIDKGDFYVIDLSVMENITLTYGKDYEKITEENVSNLQDGTLDDIYIINSISHNIFYVKGIKYENKTYYREDQDDAQSDIGISQITDIITESLNNNWSSIYQMSKKYEDKNGDTAIIPEGFKVSRNSGEDTIKEGLVIADENDNEFVWVPVNNPSQMYGTLIDGTVSGKLYYNWTKTGSDPLNWTEENKIMQLHTNTDESQLNCREPDQIEEYDNNLEYLSILKDILGTEFINGNAFKGYLQTQFRNMIDSVEKNKGFYIGRYETTIDGNVIKIKKGEESTDSSMEYKENTQMQWYGLYAKQQLYSTNSVQGQMIWGCQYDQMLKWMQTNENIDISSITPVLESNRNTSNITGSIEKDKLNNVYDLLGNKSEWTVEANNNSYRTIRSGDYNNSKEIVYRNFYNPYLNNEKIGSRLTLYLK